MISNEYEQNTKSNKCNCLPTCTTITYDTEVSHSTINWKEYVAGVSRGANRHYKKYPRQLI